MKLFELKNALVSGRMDNRLADVYEGKAQAMSQRERYIALVDHFEKSFSGLHENLRLFSTPGRTEVVGNHTDHNHGKVLAASIDLDTIAAVKETGDGLISVNSIGNGAFSIDTNDLVMRDDERGTSTALVRGICDAFVKRGYKIGGFNAAISSQVIIGSGLSSSASFEVLISTILNYLFNDGKMKPLEMAQISRYAENEFFGKPCGLMDQMACAIGGFVYIDFENPENPQVEKVEFDFEAEDHILCIVDTGGSHADLTEEYSSIKNEMCSVAAALGGEFLRDVQFTDFRSNIPLLREKVGDRAVLRAMHFYEENNRVDNAVRALLKGDFEKFKTIVKQSGDSSFKFNQNVYTSSCPKTQSVALALAICEDIFKDKGVGRVHGGGFAGTIQVFIPRDELHRFTTEIKQIFGAKSCYILSIRSEGTCEV